MFNSSYKPIPGSFAACRVEGDLCGRDKDVVLSYTWVDDSGNSDLPPHIWTSGNILIVTPETVSCGLASCNPGVLTVTASLDGVQIGTPVILTVGVF